jgi:hypothetical protein
VYFVVETIVFALFILLALFTLHALLPLVIDTFRALWHGMPALT